jgi:hypothetical protein
MTGKSWSHAEDEQLQALEAQGYSASLIGDRIYRSRESVISRSIRLRGGGKGRKATLRTTTTIIRKDGQIHKPRPKPAPVQPVDSGQRGISLFNLTETSCRWPTSGVVAPYLFCGAPRASVGSSYCPEHARMGFSHRDH